MSIACPTIHFIVNTTYIILCNMCPNCNTDINELTSFAITSNESFQRWFNAEHETELELMPEYEKNGSYPDQNQTTTDYDAAATSITRKNRVDAMWTGLSSLGL